MIYGIISEFTDKGQFQYLTNLKRPHEGTYLYTTQFQNMLHNLFSIRQFRLTKLNFLVHRTMCNAPYIHHSHDWTVEFWRTFQNALTL